MYMEEMIGANTGSTYGVTVGVKCKVDVGNCSRGMGECIRGALYPNIFSGSMVPVAGGYNLQKMIVLLRYSRVSSSKQRLAS